MFGLGTPPVGKAGADLGPGSPSDPHSWMHAFNHSCLLNASEVPSLAGCSGFKGPNAATSSSSTSSSAFSSRPPFFELLLGFRLRVKFYMSINAFNPCSNIAGWVLSLPSSSERHGHRGTCIVVTDRRERVSLVWGGSRARHVATHICFCMV